MYEAIRTARLKQRAAHVQTAIAIAATIAEWQHRRARRSVWKAIVAAVQSQQLVGGPDDIPPGADNA